MAHVDHERWRPDPVSPIREVVEVGLLVTAALCAAWVALMAFLATRTPQPNAAGIVHDEDPEVLPILLAMPAGVFGFLCLVAGLGMIRSRRGTLSPRSGPDVTYDPNRSR